MIVLSFCFAFFLSQKRKISFVTMKDTTIQSLMIWLILVSIIYTQALYGKLGYKNRLPI